MSHSQHPPAAVNVFNSIWGADKRRITPFHEKRFPQNEFHGTFVVKICDAPASRSAGTAKNHNLMKLYKWNADKKCYEKSSNKDLLQDENYRSYHLLYELLDNYECDETKPEVNTNKESPEIMKFLECIADSEPIKLAAAYLRQKFGNSKALDYEDKESFMNRSKFILKLKKIWFDQYDWGRMRSLSGFEHTFVGERRADGQVMGYHFWYKYYVDDSVENCVGQDMIDFNRRMDDAKSDDYLAIRFKQFVDADSDGIVDGAQDAQLFKSFGSFFVGLSPECKIALGTVAYYESKAGWAARRSAISSSDTGHDDEGVVAHINGHQYKLSMHRGGNKFQYCRSFFPEKI